MESLKMKQAYAEAQLSDDEGSPVVRMAMTSDKVDEYVRLYADMQSEWAYLRMRVQRGEASAKDVKRIRRLYKRVICAACGEDAYRDAVRWLRAGQDVPAKRLNALLSPLVAWITGNVLELAHPRAVSEAMGDVQP